MQANASAVVAGRSGIPLINPEESEEPVSTFVRSTKSSRWIEWRGSKRQGGRCDWRMAEQGGTLHGGCELAAGLCARRAVFIDDQRGSGQERWGFFGSRAVEQPAAHSGRNAPDRPGALWKPVTARLREDCLAHAGRGRRRCWLRRFCFRRRRGLRMARAVEFRAQALGTVCWIARRHRLLGARRGPGVGAAEVAKSLFDPVEKIAHRGSAVQGVDSANVGRPPCRVQRKCPVQAGRE
jgi:hypothetical protein